jgi:hypothetical protein
MQTSRSDVHCSLTYTSTSPSLTIECITSAFTSVLRKKADRFSERVRPRNLIQILRAPSTVESGGYANFNKSS